jgi:hypothetical protein
MYPIMHKKVMQKFVKDGNTCDQVFAIMQNQWVHWINGWFWGSMSVKELHNMENYMEGCHSFLIMWWNDTYM